MILKFLLFGILCSYFHGVQGWKSRIFNTTKSEFIAKRYLFIGDVIEISIIDLKFTDPEKIRDPLMMITVTKDKTLGYEIDRFFPYMKEKEPGLESIAHFKIDFPTKTLTNDPSSVYPNMSRIFNGTEQMIKMTSSKLGVTLLYDLTFAFSIDTAESQGLYKIYLHSSEAVTMKVEVSMPWRNVSVILFSVQILVATVLPFGIWKYFFDSSYKLIPHQQSRELGHMAGLIFTFYIWRIAFYFLLNWDNVWLKQTSTLPGEMSELSVTVILSTLMLLFVFVAMGICIVFWRRWNTKFSFQKTDKVFHIFVWLLMIDFAIQNCSIEVETILNYFLLTMLNYILLIASTMVISVATDIELTHLFLSQGFRKRYWRSRLIFASYFFVVSFKLVLAIMTYLEAPFYFHFVQTGIEDILSLWPLWIITESLLFHKHITNNNLPA